jgi:hypothetical protein
VLIGSLAIYKSSMSEFIIDMHRMAILVNPLPPSKTDNCFRRLTVLIVDNELFRGPCLRTLPAISIPACRGNVDETIHLFESERVDIGVLSIVMPTGTA